MVLNWAWSTSDWIILFLGIILALYFYGKKNHNFFSKRNIPYVKPLPFVGNFGKMCIRKQYLPDYLIEVYKELADNPVGGVFHLAQPVLLLKDPEIIKQIAVKDFEYFIDHPTFIPEDVEPLWGKALFNLKGQRWRDLRSTLTPAFTSSKMKTMFTLVSECSEQLVSFLEQCSQQAPPTDCKINKRDDLLILEMKDLFTRYTNDVIATTAFGVGVDSLKQPRNKFYTMGQDATNFEGLGSLKFFGFAISPRIMKMLGITLMNKEATDFFSSLILETIATREREGIFRPDLLHLLMQAKKGTLQDENPIENSKGNKKLLEDDDIISQSIIFFIAGFDTTSTLLCFASHQLAVHPGVQTRLQKEIDQTLQENGKFTYETIHGMKYLDMVVSETLRLYPPSAGVDRLCVKDYTLKTSPPVEIPSGTNLMIPIFALHHDPHLFPDPEVFDPERFNDENKHNIHPFAYVPFGAGPRSCIGNRFALMETKLVLAQLLSRFNFKVIDKTPMPIKLIQKGFNLSIEGGFWLGFESRTT